MKTSTFEALAGNLRRIARLVLRESRS